MTTKINQRPGTCTDCDDLVAPGAGHLWWEAGPDDGGDVAGRTPAGWRVTHTDRTICATNKAAAAEGGRLAREQRAAESESARTAKASEIANQEAQIAALLATIPSCTSSGYHWYEVGVLDPDYKRVVSLVSLPVSENPALAGLSLHHSDWVERRTLDGRICYQHSFGNASILHAPREIIEQAWAAYAQQYKATPEQAAASLAKYGPECPRVVEGRERLSRGENVPSWDLQGSAGWELDAYVAGRLDLLERYGQP